MSSVTQKLVLLREHHEELIQAGKTLDLVLIRGWQGDRQPFYFFAEKPRDHTSRPDHNAAYASVHL